MTDLENDGIVLTDEKGRLGGWVKASQSGLIGLAQAGIAAATWNPAGAVGSVASFFTAAGNISAKDPLGRIALGMVMAALLRTFHSCAGEILGDRKPTKKQLDALASAVVMKLADGKHAITRDFFTNPSSFGFLSEFAKELPAHLDLNTTQAENKVNEALLRRQFPLALDRVLIDQPNLFAPLREPLDNPASDAARRERERRLYQASLVKWFETYPLPGQQDEDDPVLLSDVFIPLRCYTEIAKSNPDEVIVGRRRRGLGDSDKDSNSSDQSETVTKPQGFGDLIRSFVEKADPKNPILMVSGGPGLGKSSSLRSMCAEFARMGTCFPVFLPLQMLQSTGSLEVRIHVALRTRVPDYWIEHDLLSHIGEIGEDRTVVLIFDGLDELIQSGREGDAALREFIQHVEIFLNAVNRNKPKARIVAVVSGRIGAADRASAALGISGGQIAHLLPFCLKDEEKRRFENDDADFVSHDQRDDWWGRWHARVADTRESMPEALKRDDLFELSREPLLLYFLVFVAAWEGASSEAEFNRNTIYAKVLQRFHKRECEKEHSNLAKAFRDYEKGYEPVLQCLALSAWYDGSTRKGVISDVETAICGIENDGKLQKAFRDTVGEQDPAFGASLAFHLKPTPDGKTFEFLHKSFAEYLIARRFVDDVVYFSERTQPKESRRGGPNLQTILKDWLEFWGAQRIDEDLLRFITDEASLSADQLARCLDGMGVLLREAIATGLPAHEIKGMRRASRKADSFAEMTDWARNAEEALLVGMHASFLSNYAVAPDVKHQSVKLVELGRGSKFDHMIVGNLLARLIRQPGQGFVAHMCLRGLDMSSAFLVRASLGGMDLNGTKLTGAILVEASLRAADLSSADLKGAILIHAELQRADLRRADLTGAILAQADFGEANLREADLRGADLSGAGLSGADLRGADLSGVNLSGTDLSGTNLSDNDSIATVHGLRESRGLGEADLPQGWSAKWNEDDEAWDITTPDGPYVDPRERKARS
ncbi:pentapeptide repeat-containing protein [uncultured Hoeflea sp.]|uniref:pentapeptide repeat-containing protein n=1 Tax=uncultured Hoeflea sp. TaxID=538666 RepID=UPI0030ED0641|tara:strand:+ start:14062 stop:17052 length:2991 start_codon:yes stop_codon:yes gene_type:complete